ncbi:MAG: prepilin-type N-terminal cleavage/methylation domain-containing protein [Planctomycetes bacterium]|nr:prepilin-type N-terminal cleavage/methylation domain-containing protein [Planctomycetota bacterium]
MGTGRRVLTRSAAFEGKPTNHTMIRNRNKAGFTLIELMIVVAIIAIIASIAIPRLLSARLAANESAAIATLRSLSSAQAQLQSSAAIDTDADGGGEYGYFAELAGTTPMRVSAAGVPAAGAAADTLNPAVLSSAFGNVDANGVVTRSGYCFSIFLPDGAAVPVGVAEAAGGGSNAGAFPGSDNAEILWCSYAWPQNVGNSGNRCFFINQEGDLLQTANRGTGGPQYTAAAGGPAWSAAYTAADMSSNIASGAAGVDLNTWVPVQ